MASTSRYGSDKEVGAVIFNVKEQKYLQKSMHTLDIEQSYSLKLLELDHRVLRVNHQRLKDRVNRIRSNLTPDHILELRQLEDKGLLKPANNSVNIGSAMKIAAASRRLNLNGSRPLTRSAPVSSQRRRLQGNGIETGSDGRSMTARSKVVPSVSGSESQTSPTEHREDSGHDSEYREDFSIPRVRSSPRKTGSYMIPPSTPRPDKDSGGATVEEEEEENSDGEDNLKYTTRSEPNKLGDQKSSPVAPTQSARDETGSTHHKHLRPVTTAASGRTRQALVPKRPQTHHGTSPTSAPFSSHTIADKEHRQHTPRDPLLRKRSSIVEDSLDTNFGENLYEERRMNMLRMETIHSVILAKRKEAFLQEMDDYLDESKNVSFSKQISVDSQDGEGGKRIHSASRGRVDFVQPGDVYKSRLLNMWKGLNKCRYLRVPDSVIDLSGIRTLARDQFQLNSLWQRYSQSPH